MTSQGLPDSHPLQMQGENPTTDDSEVVTAQNQQGDDTEATEQQTPQLHTVTLLSQYLHAIKSGAKTVEGRTYCGKYKDICVGDMIHFVSNTNPDEEVVARVTHVNVYPGFKEMLIAEGLSACLPGVSNIDEGVQIYHSFPMYEERSKQYGALALRIKTMP